MRLQVSLGVVGALMISACDIAGSGPRLLLPTVEGATIVGTETCLACHPAVGEAFKGTPHARPVTKRSDGCETCHGPGSKHVASLNRQNVAAALQNIRNSEVLRSLDAASRSALCLKCHARQIPHFPDSEHAGASVSCWDCHRDVFHTPPPVAALAPTPVVADEKVERPSDSRLTSGSPGADQARMCYQCHGEIQGDFLLQFHHPVPERRMRCTDCHTIHGEDLLVAGDAGNERCFSCHEEIRGPFIFEHLALEEGCVVCHTPHGSIVDKLLTQANNGLCEQCHFDARFPLIGGVDHTRLLFSGALCYDCHFDVHGSNTDENLRPLRIEKLLRHGGRP